MPPRARHRDPKHLGWTDLWAGADHPGGGTWGFWRDTADLDEDLHNSVLSERARIRGDLIDGTADQS